MRRLRSLATLLIAVAAVIFAVANRHEVRLELWPLPWSVDLPLYLLVLVPLALGLAVGMAVGGIGRRAARRHARAERLRADALARQIDAARPPTLPPS
ncbi:MAG: DUF1049 domain-containing protein [Magnetospirillum sp.]|nr:DUF1049 domain-containing protein [Magnetospirillum sp.]